MARRSLLTHILKKQSRRICAVYMLAGLIWITFSDYATALLANFVSDQITVLISISKGYLFIFVTAAILYGFLAASEKRLGASYQAVLKAKAQYRDLFTDTPLPIALARESDGHVLAANPAALMLIFKGRDQRGPLHLSDLIPGFDDVCLAQFKENGGELYISFFSTRASQLDALTVRACASRAQDCEALLIVLEDRSLDRKVSHEHHKAQRLLANTQTLGHMGVWEYQFHSKELICSEGAQKILDLPSAQHSLNHYPLDALTEKMPQVEAKQLVDTLNNIRPTELFERVFTVEIVAGIDRRIMFRGECMQHGKYDKVIVGSCVDFTERFTTQQQLVERERLYRRLVDLMPDAVIITKDDVITYANVASAQIFGFEHEQQLHGFRLKDFFAETELTKIDELLLLLDKDQDVHRIEHAYMRGIRGKQFDANISARANEVKDAHIVQYLIRDISYQVKMDTALKQSNLRLSQLASQSLSDLELERQQISKALHDEIGQSLTAITLSAGLAARQAHQPELGELITTVIDTSKDALEKVRDLSLMLRPPQLDELGLESAANWLADRLLTPKNIDWLVIGPNLPELSPDTEIVAFRVIQECITNIVRHAEACRVEIKIRVHDNSLVVTVTDDGKGFDTSQESDHLGLKYMNERVAITRGKLKVISGPGLGTCVKVILPLFGANYHSSPSPEHSDSHSV